MDTVIPSLWNTIINFALTVGIRLIIAVIVFFVGLRVISAITKAIESRANDKHTDKTVVRTLAYIAGIGLKVLLIICLVAFLGFDVSALTALVASFGVCVGLAVNGALSNVAGGVLILVTRPFRVDDFIEAQGISGTVVDIHMTNTKLLTPDNRVVFVPNGALSAGNVVNYSMMDTRRVDFTFAISSASDIDRAKKIVQAICAAHDQILKDPAPFVRISKLDGASNEIVTRVWVKSADYWDVNFDVIETVREAFAGAGISVPVQTLNVNVNK